MTDPSHDLPAVISAESSITRQHQEQIHLALASSTRSPATRALYRSQWRAWSAWAHQHRHRVFPADPAAIAAYLTDRAAGRWSPPERRGGPAGAAKVATLRAAEIGDPTATPGVREVIRGLARDCAAPQRQAQGLTADECAALISRSTYPRKLPSGRIETARAARRRGQADAAIAGLLFQGALRRSEAAALKWGDIEETEAGILVHVRRSKTNAEGAQVDVRFLKNGPAAAVLALRPPRRCSGSAGARGHQRGKRRETLRGGGPGRRVGGQLHGPLGSGRACLRTGPPGGLHHRCAASGRMEDGPHGRPLLRRGGR